MEIIAEILFTVFGWVLEIAGEFLLQMLFEGIAELFGHLFKVKIFGAKSPHRAKPPLRPELAAIGYVVLGAASGAASLWLMPTLFIRSEPLRFVNLVVTPLLSGATMGWIGSWRRRHDKTTLRLESFAYGFSFAFSMAVVRFVFGH
ncbi:MAG TPA: hypothetical protein VKI18_05400 [Albitalea sp.]|nr:hypothetical protein [Albitalea sp.]